MELTERQSSKEFLLQKVGLDLVAHDSPQCCSLGPVLFNVLINNLDAGVECTVSKFADDTNWELLRDKKPLQRDPDRLEHWTMIKAMKFNMSKCWILDPGQSNSGLKYRLGEEWLESRSAKGSGDAGPQQALCE